MGSKPVRLHLGCRSKADDLANTSNESCQILGTLLTWSASRDDLAGSRARRAPGAVGGEHSLAGRSTQLGASWPDREGEEGLAGSRTETERKKGASSARDPF
jgi:hypothetical protein